MIDSTSETPYDMLEIFGKSFTSILFQKCINHNANIGRTITVEIKDAK